MENLSGYKVELIPTSVAQEIVIANHYLHRKASCSKAFGLFANNGEMLGVVMYGITASPSLQKGIAGQDEASNIYELTRLWVHDSAPKNGESFLIGNSLKKLDKEIIVSFADSGQNHLGIVYQATNFLYTGLSDRHVEWKLDGESAQHSRHLFDLYGGVNKAKAVLGDRLQRHERTRKHRYIFINARGRRRKQLLSKLKYPILPYPKNK